MTLFDDRYRPPNLACGKFGMLLPLNHNKRFTVFKKTINNKLSFF